MGGVGRSKRRRRTWLMWWVVNNRWTLQNKAVSWVQECVPEGSGGRLSEWGGGFTHSFQSGTKGTNSHQVLVELLLLLLLLFLLLLHVPRWHCSVCKRRVVTLGGVKEGEWKSVCWTLVSFTFSRYSGNDSIRCCSAAVATAIPTAADAAVACRDCWTPTRPTSCTAFVVAVE